MPGAFRVGSEVEVTIQGAKRVGEVMAFDPPTGFLMIRSPVPGARNLCNLTLLNMDYISEIRVIGHNDPGQLTPMPCVDARKLRERLRSGLEESRRQMSHIGVNVSSHGQSLFCRIVRTIENTRWEGKNIVAMDEVWIAPPYGVEDCSSTKPNSQALVHVRKVVQKFLDDTNASASTAGNNAASSSATASTSSYTPGGATASSSASNFSSSASNFSANSSNFSTDRSLNVGSSGSISDTSISSTFSIGSSICTCISTPPTSSNFNTNSASSTDCSSLSAFDSNIGMSSTDS